MPSKTRKQAAAMRVAAHGPPRKGGIPKAVARKFVAADRKAKRKPRR